MYILKNAFISITRNKGRNLLIGLVVLVIACCCTITLAINNTASDLITSYSDAYQKELTISFNRDAMKKDFDFSNRDEMEKAKESFENIETYTIDDVESFAESEYITSYYYTYSFSLNGKDIEPVSMDNDDNTDQNKNFGGGHGNIGKMKLNSLDFVLSGYSSIDSMNEFINGTYTITEVVDNAWDIAFDGDYIFINEELANYNELDLGDTIKLEDEDKDNVYEFEIIGIFTDNSLEEGSMMSMFSNSANTIITNSDALVKIDSGNDSIKGTITPTFIIDSYNNVDLIQEEFYEKGLNNNYSVTSNQEVVESAVSSIQNVKSFAASFLVITMIIGGIVLFVINMINIRERKYEIGVLRTIGLSKFKLTLQFVSELLIVACISLIFGALIGATMSRNVSNSLLSNEIDNSQKYEEEINNNFGGNPGNRDKEMNIPGFKSKNGIPTVQAYDSIDAVVDISVIFELMGIGIVLVLISSVSALISIQRFSPLTILKERS